MTNRDARILIFDFDGTVADSFLLTVQLLRQLLHDPPGRIDSTALRGMSTLNILERFHASPWRGILLIPKLRLLMKRHLTELAVIPGMDQALQTLSQDNVLYIVSANSTASIREFLRRHELDTYFSGIYGDMAPWAKRRMLRRMKRMHSASASEMWYIGDMDSDVRAAHHAGLLAVGVAWGFCNLHMLRRSKSDALVLDPEQLVRIFEAKKGTAS